MFVALQVSDFHDLQSQARRFFTSDEALGKVVADCRLSLSPQRPPCGCQPEAPRSGAVPIKRDDRHVVRPIVRNERIGLPMTHAVRDLERVDHVLGRGCRTQQVLPEGNGLAALDSILTS